MNVSATDAEKVWLAEIHTRWLDGRSVEPREMMVALEDRLGPGFQPEIVNGTFVGAKSITALGVYVVDPTSKLLSDADKLIQAGRELLRKKPATTHLTAEWAARELRGDALYAGRVLYLIASMGRLTSGGAGRVDGGMETIDVGQESNLTAFLGYRGIEPHLEAEVARRRLQAPAARPRNPLEERPPQPTIPRTAFVLMQIDPANKELEDVLNGIKQVCALFDIRAIRADEIQHDDKITEVVIDHIQRCEFLIADLTSERPNVYYEVGFAHAINKKPILYRKAGTRVHFDLSVHNVREYLNVTELKRLLTDRLEAMLGRSPAHGGAIKDTARVTEVASK